MTTLSFLPLFLLSTLRRWIFVLPILFSIFEHSGRFDGGEAEELFNGFPELLVARGVDERIRARIEKCKDGEGAMQGTSPVWWRNVTEIEAQVGDLIGRPGHYVDEDDDQHEHDDAVTRYDVEWWHFEARIIACHLATPPGLAVERDSNNELWGQHGQHRNDEADVERVVGASDSFCRGVHGGFTGVSVVVVDENNEGVDALEDGENPDEEDGDRCFGSGDDTLEEKWMDDGDVALDTDRHQDVGRSRDRQPEKVTGIQKLAVSLAENRGRDGLRPRDREEKDWGEEVGHGQGPDHCIHSLLLLDPTEHDSDHDSVSQHANDSTHDLRNHPPRPPNRIPCPARGLIIIDIIYI